MDDVQIALLGPLQVTVDGVAVPVPGSRLRALLIRLAVDAPRAVSSSELVDTIWADEPPAEAANALQSLVSRLRRALGGSSSVLAEATGYRLAVQRDAIDANRFAALVDDARRLLRDDQPQAAVDACAAALDLWRGEPLAEAGDAPYVGGLVAGVQNQRLDAIGIRNDALLELGRGPELITELERLVQEHPLREQFVVQQLRALAAAGRAGEALAAYERCRAMLADEFGSDPGPLLQQTHLALLRGELPADAGAEPDQQTNLTPALTSFVGREAELDRIAGALASSRLTTIVGPGGAGKTRIAAEAARGWLERTGSAAWLVELAPVGTAANIIGAVLSALGLRDAHLADRTKDRVPSPDDTERLVDHLRRHPCLLVLDNCEHLIDAAAKTTEDLLSRAPQLRILATSREPLAITGEMLCALPPLGLPPADCPLDRASGYPAVRLWLDRATAIDPGFRLDDATLPAVLEIVNRLDGLPLAIELAAARLRALPVIDIARLLFDRFRLLTGGSRTSMPRHRTLRAVVEWSWDLLTDAERLLAMRMSILPAGAGIDTATAICADDRLASDTVGELLITLTDKSLLQRSSTSPVRFRMLETIREYGQERLTESDGLAAARRRHADYFLDLVQQLEPALRDRRQLAARAQLELERENIFAAIRYLLDNDRPHDGLLMILAQLWYFQVQDHEGELAYWLDQAIIAYGDSDDPLLDYGLLASALASVSVQAADAWTEVRDRLRPIMPRLQDGPKAPFASLEALRMMLPMFIDFVGDGAESGGDGSDGDRDDLATRPFITDPQIWSDYATKMITEAEDSDDVWIRGIAYLGASGIAENQGDLDAIDRYATEAYRAFETCGDRWGLSSTLSFRAQVESLRGNTSAATALLEESLGLSPTMGAEDDALIIHLRLAGLSIRADDLPAARRHLESLRAAGRRNAANPERVMFADAIETELLWLEGDPDGAMTLADKLRGELAAMPHPNRFAGHRVALCCVAIAYVEALAAVEHPIGSTTQRDDHLRRGLADLRNGYRPTVMTEDIPMISEFANSSAALAAAAGQPQRAAFLLGIGAGLIGIDNAEDRHRARIKEQLRCDLDADRFAAAFESGRRCTRAEAFAALDPEQLITVCGFGDQLSDGRPEPS
ncbi:BTAD domain-containing putative transcriptional regulator [Microlunatus soli]|uniref:Predicted ATPase n=1 Tax=Microlunatus soli TaxID=630515 RepID=A0A1H1NGP6_9ACTN|nr:BTAD domain-containing putative transcriptional regulator [Microlunatus soli]SDR98112.1 Predicted ATPase [Microlunatus soli]